MLYFIFPFPPVVWRFTFLALCVYSLLLRRTDIPFLQFEKALFIFASLNFVYFLFSYFWQNPNTSQIGSSLCTLLSFSLFYYLGKSGALTEKFLNTIIIILTISAFFAYRQAEALLLVSMDRTENITNNASTNYLYLLILLFVIRKQWIRIIVMITSTFLLLHSAKRGNILASVPMILLLMPTFWKSGQSLFRRIVIVIVLAISAYYLYQFYNNYEYLQHRIEQTKEGSSSHRDEIYYSSWRLWIDADSYHRLFLGYGADGTIHNNIDNYRAHNDWLEVLVDYGLLGVLLYLYVFLTFLRLVWKNRRKKVISHMLLACFLTWFLKTLYSMGYTDERLILLMFALGIALSNTYEKEPDETPTLLP